MACVYKVVTLDKLPVTVYVWCQWYGLCVQGCHTGQTSCHCLCVVSMVWPVCTRLSHWTNFLSLFMCGVNGMACVYKVVTLDKLPVTVYVWCQWYGLCVQGWVVTLDKLPVTVYVWCQWYGLCVQGWVVTLNRLPVTVYVWCQWYGLCVQGWVVTLDKLPVTVYVWCQWYGLCVQGCHTGQTSCHCLCVVSMVWPVCTGLGCNTNRLPVTVYVWCQWYGLCTRLSHWTNFLSLFMCGINGMACVYMVGLSHWTNFLSLFMCGVNGMACVYKVVTLDKLPVTVYVWCQWYGLCVQGWVVTLNKLPVTVYVWCQWYGLCVQGCHTGQTSCHCLCVVSMVWPVCTGLGCHTGQTSCHCLCVVSMVWPVCTRLSHWTNFLSLFMCGVNGMACVYKVVTLNKLPVTVYVWCQWYGLCVQGWVVTLNKLPVTVYVWYQWYGLCVQGCHTGQTSCHCLCVVSMVWPVCTGLGCHTEQTACHCLCVVSMVWPVCTRLSHWTNFLSLFMCGINGMACVYKVVTLDKLPVTVYVWYQWYGLCVQGWVVTLNKLPVTVYVWYQWYGLCVQGCHTGQTSCHCLCVVSMVWPVCTGLGCNTEQTACHCLCVVSMVWPVCTRLSHWTNFLSLFMCGINGMACVYKVVTLNKLPVTVYVWCQWYGLCVQGCHTEQTSCHCLCVVSMVWPVCTGLSHWTNFLSLFMCGINGMACVYKVVTLDKLPVTVYVWYQWYGLCVQGWVVTLNRLPVTVYVWYQWYGLCVQGCHTGQTSCHCLCVVSMVWPVCTRLSHWTNFLSLFMCGINGMACVYKVVTLDKLHVTVYVWCQWYGLCVQGWVVTLDKLPVTVYVWCQWYGLCVQGWVVTLNRLPVTVYVWYQWYGLCVQGCHTGQTSCHCLCVVSMVWPVCTRLSHWTNFLSLFMCGINGMACVYKVVTLDKLPVTVYVWYQWYGLCVQGCHTGQTSCHCLCVVSMVWPVCTGLGCNTEQTACHCLCVVSMVWPVCTRLSHWTNFLSLFMCGVNGMACVYKVVTLDKLPVTVYVWYQWYGLCVQGCHTGQTSCHCLCVVSMVWPVCTRLSHWTNFLSLFMCGVNGMACVYRVGL